jgi:GntR family transcriptional repressor for pyruvate dehydrogenase complex
MSDINLLLAARDERTAPRLSTAIYEGILAMITRGDFAASSKMPSEARLCEMFGASRPVVREALARLKEDGIVVSRQGSGSYVRRQPDPSLLDLAPIGTLGDLQRCFEFRANTEPSSAGLAALRWQQDDMDRIDASMRELERCMADGVIGTDEDCSLHEAIAEATHNSYHRLVQRQLRPHILAGMNVTRSLTLRRPEARLRMVQDEHVAVVEAIRRRDVEGATIFMRTHILNARHRMFEGVDT